MKGAGAPVCNVVSIQTDCSAASSRSILFLENRTESMNATHIISTTMEVATATIPMGARPRGPRTAMHRAMAIPLFLYDVIRMSVTLWVYAALFTNVTLIFYSLVFTAMTFPVLHRPENLFAEKTVSFGFLGTVVNRFGFCNLTERPFSDFLRRSNADLNRIEIV